MHVHPSTIAVIFSTFVYTSYGAVTSISIHGKNVGKSWGSCGTDGPVGPVGPVGPAGPAGPAEFTRTES